MQNSINRRIIHIQTYTYYHCWSFKDVVKPKGCIAISSYSSSLSLSLALSVFLSFLYFYESGLLSDGLLDCVSCYRCRWTTWAWPTKRLAVKHSILYIVLNACKLSTTFFLGCLGLVFEFNPFFNERTD